MLGFSVFKGDISRAFLQGQQLARQLYIRPPQELRTKLKLAPNDFVKLNKGAYGLVQAPRLWFESPRDFLLELGFAQTLFDPCLLVLRRPGYELSLIPL